MEEAIPSKPPRSAWRSLLDIGIEALLILAMVGLICAILAPVFKGPSSEAARQPEFGPRDRAGNVRR